MANKRNNNNTSGTTTNKAGQTISTQGTTRTEKAMKANPLPSTNKRVSGKKKDGNSIKQTGAASKAQNDPAWYAKSPEMMTSASSINFYQPAGKQIGFWNIGLNSDSDPLQSIPGLAVLHYMPGIGVSKDSTSPASIAARSIYTDLRYFQSGSANYEAPNYMMYCLAAANAYAMYAYMKRLYGTIRRYNSNNMYQPEAMIRMMGFDPNTVRSHGLDLYWYMNMYLSKLSAFVFPSGMPFFDRYMFMLNGYYLDNEAVSKAQMYMFEPHGFWKYDETSEPGKGCLKFIPNNWTTLDEMYAVADELLGALSSSEDCYIMSGDTYKAWGDSVFKTEPVALDYVAEIRFDIEILEQIHNATIIGAKPVPSFSDTDRTSITIHEGDDGALIYDPCFEKYGFFRGHNQVYNGKRFFTICTDDVKPEFVMTSSRLACTGEFIDADTTGIGTKLRLNSCGTEVITGVAIVYFHNHVDDDDNETWEITASSLASTPAIEQNFYGNMTTASYANMITGWSLLSVFGWHPFVSLTYNESQTNMPRVGYWTIDLDNYTTVDPVQLDRMHTTALLSLFDVPELTTHRGK